MSLAERSQGVSIAVQHLPQPRTVARAHHPKNSP
jgi:hypothetical protein